MPDEGRSRQSNRSWQQSIYDELYRLAERALGREAAAHSLQPTMLVDDAYLYLLKQRNVDMARRSQVLAAGARFLRRILVDQARKRGAQKRGGDCQRYSLHLCVADDANRIDVLDLNDALKALAVDHPRAAQVVELKFFGGLTGEEVADHLSISLRTVNTDWRFAKAWLYRRLSDKE